MRIDHIAIWTNDIEALREFYVNLFDFKSGERYENPTKGYASYFLTYETGARLEIMSRTDIQHRPDDGPHLGYAHFSIALGSEEQVLDMAKRVEEYGCVINDGPRTTGDGYFEFATKDPDGNVIEVMA